MKFHSSFASLGENFYSLQAPEALEHAEFVGASSSCAQLLGLSQDELEHGLAAELAQGRQSELAPSSLAMVYAGHQFGHFVPQLGDGRGLLLGEVEGIDGKLYDLHLKGAGKTPYSRFGDGRAVLRSSIREMLASEFLAAAAVPTSRVLNLFVCKDEGVQREEVEPRASYLRVSDCHVRLGHFEYFSHQEDYQSLQELVDYSVSRWFPQTDDDSPQTHLHLFEQCIRKTMELMARWQSIGFVHGVMNTDNLTINGLTFDFGPYAFLDDYLPDFTPNCTDVQGMYCFARQPMVGVWNMKCLLQALAPLGNVDEMSDMLHSLPQQVYFSEFERLMAAKLGLEGIDDKLLDQLQKPLMQMLQDEKLDYTLFFRQLSSWQGETPLPFAKHEQAEQWQDLYVDLVDASGGFTSARREQMLACNPALVPRNAYMQQVIDSAEQGDYSSMRDYLEVLQSPFEAKADDSVWAKRPATEQRFMKNSCSS